MRSEEETHRTNREYENDAFEDEEESDEEEAESEGGATTTSSSESSSSSSTSVILAGGGILEVILSSDEEEGEDVEEEQEENSLIFLASDHRWAELFARIDQLTPSEATAQLSAVYLGNSIGSTTIHYVMDRDAPYYLVSKIASLAPSSFQVECLNRRGFPLHYSAASSTDRSVVSLVASIYPDALLLLDENWDRPLDVARKRILDNLHPAEDDDARDEIRRDIVSLLEDLTARRLDYENQVCVKLCISHLKSRGFSPYVRSRSFNTLPPFLFVFAVLDEMIQCHWSPQAEVLVSFVGRNVALPDVVDCANAGTAAAQRLTAIEGGLEDIKDRVVGIEKNIERLAEAVNNLARAITVTTNPPPDVPLPRTPAKVGQVLEGREGDDKKKVTP